MSIQIHIPRQWARKGPLAGRWWMGELGEGPGVHVGWPAAGGFRENRGIAGVMSEVAAAGCGLVRQSTPDSDWGAKVDD